MSTICCFQSRPALQVWLHSLSGVTITTKTFVPGCNVGQSFLSSMEMCKMYEVEAGISPTARLPSPGAGSKALLWHTSQMYMYGRGADTRAAEASPSGAKPSPAKYWQPQPSPAVWQQAARRGQSSFLGGLSVIVSCYGLRDKERKPQRANAILSLSQQPHRTVLRCWAPFACKASSLL